MVSRILLWSLILGSVILFVSISILFGFKRTVQKNITHFLAHIYIVESDFSESFETSPVNTYDPFFDYIKKQPEIEHAHFFATKPTILQSDDQIEGLAIKGIGTDYTSMFFSSFLIKGRTLHTTDSVKRNEVIISNKIARLLDVDTGQKVTAYFISTQNKMPRARRFNIVGIYKSDIAQFDETYIFCDIRHIQKLNDWKSDQVSGMEIFLKDFNQLPSVSRRLLKTYRLAYLNENNDLTIETLPERIPIAFNWLNMLDYNVIIIFILIILVAAINISSLLLIKILDNVQHIGILKTLGYNNQRILTIYLIQGFFLITRGIIIGNIIGIGVVAVQYFTHWLSLDPKEYFVSFVPVEFCWTAWLWVDAGAIIIITIVLLLPVWIISTIKPDKSLRFE